MRLPPIVLLLALAACAPHPGGPPPRDARHTAWHGYDDPDRDPSRGLLFISPMGEPFRGADPERAWFDAADTDHDGRLTAAEFNADALRWFAVIDRGHDGEIDPDDIDYYENTLVPEIRTGSGGARGGAGGAPGRGGGGGRHGGGGRMGGGGMGGSQGGGGPGGFSFGNGGSAAKAPAVRQGASRYSYLDIPEPLTAMDRNLNRGIDRDEMTFAALERFHDLDRNGDGALTRGELPRVAQRSAGPGPRERQPRHRPQPGDAPEDE